MTNIFQVPVPLVPMDLIALLDTQDQLLRFPQELNADILLKFGVNPACLVHPRSDFNMISVEPLKPLTYNQVRDMEDFEPVKDRFVPQKTTTILTLAKFVLPDDQQRQLNKSCNLKFIAVESVRDLFNHIADPNKNIGIIIIGGWPEVFAESRLTLIEVINAVKTIIQCSGKTIPLAVGINSTIDAATIQDIRRMPIDYIWPGSTEFSVETKIETMQAMLAGRPFVHVRLEPLLKPRREKGKTTKVELTPRQNQIMELVSQRGASNKVIARMLGITESTVKLHMSGILKKFGVRNRTQLALFARDKAQA